MGQGRKFSIREVSEICNIPSKTLRYYDEIALVVPEFRDESSRYRYYSKDQIITLCIIRKLRKMGFGLKAIQCIISGNTATDLERNIETKLDEIAEAFNLPVLARLPIDPKVAEAYDSGMMETVNTDSVTGVIEAIEKL